MGFQQKYNDVDFDIDLFLDNSLNMSSGGDTAYAINPSSVLSFAIEDTLASWITQATLIFMYLPDDSNTDTGQSKYGQKNAKYVAGSQDAEKLTSYQFRADGFDILKFRGVPITKKAASGDNLEINSKDPKWTLTYLFSIYDVEDVGNLPGLTGPSSAYTKCLKLYLRDFRYQILQTTNLEYSTSLSSKANFSSGLFNGNPQGTLKTGIALNEVLNQALTDSSNGGDSIFAVSEDTEKWEEGSSEMFYTSPAQWSALDDVNYLYGHHVSTKQLGSGVYDISLLHTKRSTEAGKICEMCLTPISDFFENALDGDQAGEDQIEHFFVTSHTDLNAAGLATKQMAPFSDNKDRDLKTFKYGQIVSYSFVDMSPNVNSLLYKSTPVYSVDPRARVFDVKFQNNTVETSRELITNNYIEKLFKKGSGTDLFLPTLHQQKQKGNKNIFPTFSLNGEQSELAEILRQKNGISQLLYTGLFQNTCICFSTFGLTHREPGKFIAIDHINQPTESDYNIKLYGQWFIVKVVHSFETGAYMNLIYALKLHRFTSAQQKFANTI